MDLCNDLREWPWYGDHEPSSIKMIDVHSTEPLLLCSLFNGSDVNLWIYQTKHLIKKFEVVVPIRHELLSHPVRCVKFITEA